MKLDNLLGEAPMWIIIGCTGLLILIFQIQRKGYLKVVPWYEKNRHWVLICLLIGVGIILSFDGKWVLWIPILLAGLAVWWQQRN